MNRSSFLAAVAAAFLWAVSLPVGAQNMPPLRIGLQKSASLLALQKSQGTLEKRLQPLGVAVKWVEFPAGPQLLEGLNVGAIDVGFVGEAPPIFGRPPVRDSSTSATTRRRHRPRPSSCARTPPSAR
jgi:sulfonate transport system substrate-binding protein